MLYGLDGVFGENLFLLILFALRSSFFDSYRWPCFLFAFLSAFSVFCCSRFDLFNMNTMLCIFKCKRAFFNKPHKSALRVNARVLCLYVLLFCMFVFSSSSSLEQQSCINYLWFKYQTYSTIRVCVFAANVIRERRARTKECETTVIVQNQKGKKCIYVC